VSNKVKPPARSRCISQASAIFEASVARENIDSPMNAAPSATP